MTHITISEVAGKYIISLFVNRSLKDERVTETYIEATDKAFQLLRLTSGVDPAKK